MTARIRFRYGSDTSSTTTTGGLLVIDITLKNCSHVVKIYDLHPGDLTAYFDIPSGNINIKVDQSGIGKGIIKSSGRVSDSKYTILVDVPPKLQIFQDDFRCPKPGTALVRVLPTSSDYSPVKAGTIAVGSLPVSVISGGVYTAFVSRQMTTTTPIMISHDNDAPRSAPPQACEKTVDDFNIIKFSGLWYRQMSGCATRCAYSTVTYTPLDKVVRVHEICYNSQWMRLGEINTMAVMLRVSELTIINTASNAIDMTMSVPMITSVSSSSLASLTSMTGMTGTVVNDTSASVSMTNMSQYPGAVVMGATIPGNGAMVIANPMMTNQTITQGNQIGTVMVQGNQMIGNQMTGNQIVSTSNQMVTNQIGTVMVPGNQMDTVITLVIHATDYTSYALVGTPTRTSFHILSRCKKIDQDTYKYLLKKASDLGYNMTGVCKEIN